MARLGLPLPQRPGTLIDLRCLLGGGLAGLVDELGQDGPRVADEGDLDREGPPGVARVDVDLDDRLIPRIEDLRPFADGIGRRQLRAHHQHGVGLAHHVVGQALAVHAHHAEGQRMRLFDGALALVGGRHRHSPHLGQLPQRIVGTGVVDSFARHDDGPARAGQDFDGPGDVLGRRGGRRGGQVASRVVKERRGLDVDLADDGGASHQDARRPRIAADGVFDRQLHADDGFLRLGGQRGVLGHRAKDAQQVDAPVLAGPRLGHRMLGHAAVGGVGEDHHWRAAQVGLHHPEAGVGAHEHALTHDHGGPAAGAGVGVGHDRRRLLVPDEDRADPVLFVEQRGEDRHRPAAGDAEDELDSGLFQHLHDVLMSLRHGYSLCSARLDHRRRLRASHQTQCFGPLGPVRLSF